MTPVTSWPCSTTTSPACRTCPVPSGDPRQRPEDRVVPEHISQPSASLLAGFSASRVLLKQRSSVTSTSRLVEMFVRQDTHAIFNPDEPASAGHRQCDSALRSGVCASESRALQLCSLQLSKPAEVPRVSHGAHALLPRVEALAVSGIPQVSRN